MSIRKLDMLMMMTVMMMIMMMMMMTMHHDKEIVFHQCIAESSHVWIIGLDAQCQG